MESQSETDHDLFAKFEDLGICGQWKANLPGQWVSEVLVSTTWCLPEQFPGFTGTVWKVGWSIVYSDHGHCTPNEAREQGERMELGGLPRRSW